MTRKSESEERPSKSERKRAAHAAQDLGETLIGLRDSELAALALPERLLEAIHEARRTSSRGGAARQRQYIGKLMREIDPVPIQTALAARSERTALDAERFKRLEAWRERLLAEGPVAVDDLQKWRPGIDRSEWLARIDAVHAERSSSGAAAASRALFRALRDLFDAGN